MTDQRDHAPDDIVRLYKVVSRAVERAVEHAAEMCTFLAASIPPAGTRDGDLFRSMLIFGGPPFPEHMDALERIAAQIPWYPRNDPKVHRALMRRVDAERLRRQDFGDAPADGKSVYQSVKHRVLVEALTDALNDRLREQTMRFGRHWVTNDDGRKRPVRPADLSMLDGFFDSDPFWRWLTIATPKAARANLLDEPYPREDGSGRAAKRGKTTKTPSRKVVRPRLFGRRDPLLASLANTRPDGLASLLNVDDRSGEPLLRLIWNVASPRQRQLAECVGDGMSLVEAASALGMAPATARVQWKRLRDKVM